MSSGGLIYHLRALCYNQASRNALWSQHRTSVEKFLEKWNPPEKTLVLVGPSGGYSLHESFLQKFETVVAIEPDPIARFIFSKRFSIHVNWVPKALPFHELSKFTEMLPEASAVLFCNLLGQVPLRNLKELRSQLFKILDGHSWASYHDALSGKQVQFDAELLPSPHRATLAQMKATVYPMVNHGTVVVNAHQAPELFHQFQGYPHFYWQWRILPKRTHLIEGLFHRNS